MASPDSPPRLEDATVSDIHRAMAAGDLTARELTEWHLDRIDRFDDRLGAFIHVSADVRDRLEELDERFEAEGPVGPLHGIPVVLKDNVDVAGTPTTAGSQALANAFPPDDATIVRRLREAGAVVLGKTNLDEFARGGDGYSPLGGQIHNPYDLDRHPGGSSGGTAVALAANLAVVGMGTDTGGSVRLPAAYTNTVGLRPTVGLVSRDGIVPNALTHDTAGPMARTVEDVAAVLDAIAGYDPADRATARGHGRRPGPPEGNYRDSLREDALDGARIGLLSGTVEAAGDEVTTVLAEAEREMGRLGATLERTTVPDTDPGEAWRDLNLVNREFARDLDAYLPTLEGDAVPSTLDELIESGQFRDDYEETFRECADVDAGALGANVEYLRRRVGLGEFRDRVLEVFAADDLDALVYPTAAVPPAPVGENVPVSALNTTLTAAAGLPALTVPAGFTDEEGLPVGIEFAGRPFGEADLLGIGYSYEQGTGHRRPPDAFSSAAD